jgi:hypothetical protein
MIVAISGNKLGVNQNLVYENDKFSWANDIPDYAWTLGFKKEKKDLQSIADALEVKLFDFKDTAHARSLREILGKDIDEVPWMHVLPQQVFKNILQKLLDQLRMIIDDKANSYYIDQFIKNRELLMQLQRSKIDTLKFNEILNFEKGKPKHSDILKFTPDADGFANLTTYSQSSTVTGRLTVKRGPGILTLKKEYREILKSRFDGGKIVQIDITSLEPRIALSMCNENIPDDVYDFISKQVFSGSLSRDESKIATLSCIYGATSWSLSKRLPDSIDAKVVLKSLKDYFGIPRLESRLLKDYKNTGFIENLYGRRIKSKDALVNHYIQSTGVDVSFNVFRKIFEYFKVNSANFIPIYVIHDAIIVDIHPDDFSKVKNLENEKFSVEKLNCKFPVKIEIIKE